MAAQARRGVLAGEGALPPVHPRLGHPPAQTALRTGPQGALAKQVRADPGQRPPAPPPQVRPVLHGQVRLHHGHHRGPHLRWGRLKLLRDHRRPVRIQTARAHRRVQPTQPGPAAGPIETTGTLSAVNAVGGQQHRRRDPPLGVHRRGRQHPRQDRGRVHRHVPQRPVRLGHGAVLAPFRFDRRQPHDRRVLHRRRDIEHLLQRPHRRRPLLARPGHPRRGQHRAQRRRRGIRRGLHLAWPDPHPAHPLPQAALPRLLRQT